MEGGSEAVRLRIRDAIAGARRSPELQRFIEEVVAQRARAIGREPVDGDDGEAVRLAAHVLRLIEQGAAGEAGISRAAAELASDHALLAAFFQNLDLLPPGRDPHVDAIALMVGEAIQRLSETLDAGPGAP